MWPTKYFDIFADITTHCNAGCPQCHRTNPDGLKKADWLPLINWTLEDFKKAYRPSTLKLTRYIQICGTWGDPIMNKDIFEICKYIMETTENNEYFKTGILLNTNGSIRDEKWWWDLGVLCGDRLRVVFGIDGKDQEQHQLYRKFTNLNKVLENMKSLSMTKAKAVAQTIVFKHNQNDLKEIKELCLRNGATNHSYVWSDRLSEKDRYFEYTNPDGSIYTLEYADKNPEEVYGVELKKEENNISDGCISCKWLKMRMVLVNPDGQVLPCCYIANNYYQFGAQVFNGQTMLDYKKEEKDNNIFHKPLEDILAESNWFNDTLPESWDSKEPVRQCVRYCSNKGESFNKLQRLSEK